MEKILKLIRKLSLLVPFLIILLSIKEVSAESIDIFNQANNYDNLYFSFQASNVSDYNKLFTFKMYNQDFDFYVNNNNTKNYNCFIFYNTNLEKYVIVHVFLTSNFTDNSTTDFSYRIFTSNKWTTYFYYKTSSNTWGQQYQVKTHAFVLSKDEEASSAYKTIFNVNGSVNRQNSNFYISYNDYQLTFPATFYNNFNDNYILVYKYKDNFYLDNENISVQNVPQPEPEEPEEPESPTLPPYNFNNNKYYVPNYEKGNCVEVLDKDTIRVFKDENTDFYIDYYINSNYISRQGQVNLDYVKNCSNLEFTDIRYYGNDFPEILFILVCILTFTIGFPYILYKRFRKR